MAEPGWNPWSQRFYALFPVAPLWVGAGLVVLILLVLLAAAWGTGDLQAYLEMGVPLHRQRDARLALILCVFVGFLPTAQQYILRFTKVHLAALEPLLDRGEEQLLLPRPSFWLCTLPGVIAVPLVGFSIDRNLALYLGADYLNVATHYFQWIVGLFVTVNLAHTSHLSFACGRALGERAGALPKIDLLDLSPLAPFAQQMVQTVLVWLVMLSIFSVNAVDPGFAPAVLVIAIYCGLNLGALWLVCGGKLQERIRGEKLGELRRIDRALRGDRGASARLCIDDRRGQLSAADLLAYRSFVDGVREGAFGASAWLRVLLYLAIPLGSWLGGAIVERILDASLK